MEWGPMRDLGLLKPENEHSPAQPASPQQPMGHGLVGLTPNGQPADFQVYDRRTF